RPPDQTLTARTLNRSQDKLLGHQEGWGCIVTGTIAPLYSEAYTLYLTSDDLSRLYLDGELVLQVTDDGNTATTAIELEADREYVVRIEWFQIDFSSSPIENPNELRWEWSSASQAREDVPAGTAAPAIDAPVTLHLGESLNGVFADPSVDMSLFQNVDLEVGSVHEIGDQLSGAMWYRFAVRDRSRQGGLIAYTGETLLARLSRSRPRESLVLVAGEGGVPNPLD